MLEPLPQLLAVGPRQRIYGVHPPGYDGLTYDWRVPPGSAGNTRGVTPAYAVLPLRNALETRYVTDAHCVGYLVLGSNGEPLERQPRVNKASVSWLKEQGLRVVLTTLLADGDNPGKALWTPDALEECEELRCSLPCLATAGWYYTASGWRIVQPLVEWVPIERAESLITHWVRIIESQGLRPDWACTDWTHLFRLPWVERGDGKVQHYAPMLDAMAPIAPPSAPPSQGESPRTRRTRPMPESFSAEVPALLRPWVGPLATAVRSVDTEWHTLALALSGALLQRAVPPDVLPALVGAVFAATGADTRVADRIDAARTTVTRRAADEAVTGLRELRTQWPNVADALDSVSGTAGELRGVATPPIRRLPILEARRELAAALAHPGDGMTLLAVECGGGKTHQAALAAVARAARTHATPGPHSRAPLGSRTVVVSRTRRLALQTTETVRAAGGTARRRFGPLSEMDETTRESLCKLADVARPLAEGGLSIPWELCLGRDKNPCPHFDTCPVAMGNDGPEDARIVVGTDGLLAELTREAGASGVLVIDEPNDPLETTAITPADIETARAQIEAFIPRYGRGLAPVMDAFAAWLREADEGKCVPIAEAIRSMADAIESESLTLAMQATGVEECPDMMDTAIHCARRAHTEDARSAAPSVERGEILRARNNPAHAATLGTACKVYDRLYRGLTATAPVTVRLEERPQGRVALVTWTRPEVARAWRREGATVALDAAAELLAEPMARVLGYAPRVVRIAIEDAAPVERCVLRTPGANRTGWFAHGRPQWELLAPSIRAAILWAMEDTSTRTLGLITYQSVELGILAALAPDDPPRAVREAWGNLRLPVASLRKAREVLRPVVSLWDRGNFETWHYYASRGFNAWADLDALVTVGDPWPNLGDVEHEAAYLGLSDGGQARALARCQAELEQAQGRLRAASRSRPGRALHVGTVRPGGSGWADGLTIRRPALGRPKSASGMTPEEFRSLVASLGHGGVQTMAHALGISTRSVRRYMTGDRPITPAVAVEVRSTIPAPAEPGNTGTRPSVSTA